MLRKVRAEYVELVIKKHRLASLLWGSSYASLPTMGAQFPRGAEIAIFGFLGYSEAQNGHTDPGEVSFDAETFWLRGVLGAYRLVKKESRYGPLKWR